MWTLRNAQVATLAAFGTLLFGAVAFGTGTACRGSEDEPTGGRDGTAADGTAANGTAASPAPHHGDGANQYSQELIATSFSSFIHSPADARERLGYLRLGGVVRSTPLLRGAPACTNGHFAVAPFGVHCATTATGAAGTGTATATSTVALQVADEQGSIVARALGSIRQPDLSKPLPYPYGFVRAIAPTYVRVPSAAEQHATELGLDRHLRSYTRLQSKWDALEVGANDLVLDADGNSLDVPPTAPPQLDGNQLYGGNGDDTIPWFFQAGRAIPKFALLDSPVTVAADAPHDGRIARKAMLAFVGSFLGPEVMSDDGKKSYGPRRFGMTTDLQLVPTSKVKPERGSTFHGVALGKHWKLPVGFVKSESTTGLRFRTPNGSAVRTGKIAHLTTLQLTGESRRFRGDRLVEASSGDWFKAEDLAIAVKPSALPNILPRDATTAGNKWIDITLHSQTLVLYEGTVPIYATVVSTGRDGLGDPATTFSTVRGVFRIEKKHVTTTMDADEVDNKFELRDVPWVQYFKGGYALHGALWHEQFGRPRSHGCINLSPIDARRLFMWSEPQLPEGWHGVYATKTTGQGTLVVIHP
jgi:hypothetical protein